MNIHPFVHDLYENVILVIYNTVLLVWVSVFSQFIPSKNCGSTEFNGFRDVSLNQSFYGNLVLYMNNVLAIFYSAFDSWGFHSQYSQICICIDLHKQ